ncbi:carboxyl transferase domain-containing protein [Piptocephalis cylindrospora]|uniref:Carboxyl transferase domain-containing protein n=1 Tax=Piptocephalis cylindrospora TaxID=1907219 RepID=A0A4P9Y308_9FUNG|nr:carboxyl transferase domain-containing protein [Piptocephalis cylindrospora]|eukprot:RKP13306.1 carboxyl transferase domain-containing protein [Piptocephalis cylindrospora]
MHLLPVDTPYQTKEWLQPRRYKAHVMGTTYVYDFPELFRSALETLWASAPWSNGGTGGARGLKREEMLTVRELVWDHEGHVQILDRPPGSNACGMVAWLMTLCTPEYPKGREIVVISNDITYQIGSFGVEEDEVFERASILARERGIPRLYLSANSGARIGLAEEVMRVFRVGWEEEGRPESGVSYLYLTPEDYTTLGGEGNASVNVERREVEVDGQGTMETRYVITDIIGRQDGLGVENLRGSGRIAGETSRAYEDIFTATLVSCRSVGIGAYLVRLGQRTVQNEGQPIILTGAPALNKVLGREVYASNLQLGGTQIMHRNGVSHLTARNDLEGVQSLLEWLSYVPSSVGQGGNGGSGKSVDPLDRSVDYMPPSTGEAYDPRWLLTGKETPEGNRTKWLPGLLDKGTWRESLSGWAKTVVVGRGRLGGEALGVIAVETRTVERRVPADPADPTSEEQTIKEAGQVWYPNSAAKTAQAIADFRRGERLPLLILANWRGFSGGQRDMYEEVLKFGSRIVDELRTYDRPALVYIVPRGELRGGAWVVLDPTINPEGHLEMYADAASRAGILEPEGLVEVKYRKPHILGTMARLDEQIKTLHGSLGDPGTPMEERAELKRELDGRQEQLLPIYSGVARHFAQLHDTPGRMKAKGVVRRVVEWSQARRVLGWRLRRLLVEDRLVDAVRRADPSKSWAQGRTWVREWAEACAGIDPTDWEMEDEGMARWMRGEWRALMLTPGSSGEGGGGGVEGSLRERFREMHKSWVRGNVESMLQEEGGNGTMVLEALMERLSPEERSRFAERLTRK